MKKTVKNGGNSTLAEVAKDWKETKHNFTLSTETSSKWAVSFTKIQLGIKK
jgi:hypothetical protein